MTTYIPINAGASGAFVLARTPGLPWRCVEEFTGPRAFERASDLAGRLTAQAAALEIGRRKAVAA